MKYCSILYLLCFVVCACVYSCGLSVCIIIYSDLYCARGIQSVEVSSVVELRKV